MPETDLATNPHRLTEQNNPFTVESSVDNLGAGGRDVPEGQEEYYQERLRRAREDATPMPETRPRTEEDEQSQGEKGASAGDDNQGKKPLTSWDEDMENNPEAQGRIARKMHALRQKRLDMQAKAGFEEEAKEGRIPGLSQYRSARNKYKRIKNIIRIIKLVAAAGSSMGDIFISAGTFIVTAHGELIYHKINPDYPFEPWEKWLIVAVDTIIFLILLIITILLIAVYQMIDNPEGALQFIS